MTLSSCFKNRIEILQITSFSRYHTQDLPVLLPVPAKRPACISNWRCLLDIVPYHPSRKSIELKFYGVCPIYPDIQDHMQDYGFHEDRFPDLTAPPKAFRWARIGHEQY